MRYLLVLIGFLVCFDVSAQLCCGCGDDPVVDPVTADAVDDIGLDGNIGDVISIDVSVNDVACSSGVTSYGVPYDFVGIVAADVVGTAPNFVITPSVVGVWSFKVDLLCDGVVIDTGNLSGEAVDPCINPSICECENFCGSANLRMFGAVVQYDNEGAYELEYIASYWDDLTIDWGDGSPLEVISSSGNSSFVPHLHVYPSVAASYTITATFIRDGELHSFVGTIDYNSSGTFFMGGSPHFTNQVDYSFVGLPAGGDVLNCTAETFSFSLNGGGTSLIPGTEYFYSVNDGPEIEFTEVVSPFGSAFLSDPNPTVSTSDFPVKVEYITYHNGIVVNTYTTYFVYASCST